MTESALFDYAFWSNGDIRIQALLHFRGPRRAEPVEIFGSVRTGVRTITTADAARINLSHQTFLVPVRRANGTNFRAMRLLALHARTRNEPSLDVRIFALGRGHHIHP